MLRTRILDTLPSSLHSVKLALYGSERQTLLHTIQVINDAQKERKAPESTSTKPVQTTSNTQANSTEGLRPSRRQRGRSWSRGRGGRGRGRGNRGRGQGRGRGTWNRGRSSTYQGYRSYNNELLECYNCGQPGHLAKGCAQRRPSENRRTQNQSSNNADGNRRQQNLQNQQNSQMNAVDTEPVFDT